MDYNTTIIERYLKKEINLKPNEIREFRGDRLAEIIYKYHKSEVEKLNILRVSNQRKLFFDFVKFMNEYYLNRELDDQMLWDDLANL